AGWTLRVTQIAAICTYFLAAWAKVRFGGWGWATGSVLARAILRRGTDLADLIAPIPYVLIAGQIGILAFEFASPLVLLAPGRWRYVGVACCYAFHAMTFALVTISFAPQLVALASFLPLERVRPMQWSLSVRTRPRRRGSAGTGTTEGPRGGGQGTGRGTAGHPIAMASDPPICGPG
ncbi:MAG TPA: MFS transporter permease, partial [Micromonosporaceae bacterium]